jgi:hypothetical protein
MSRVEKDPEREKRIEYEIIVDCYGEYEHAAGWWNHLEDRLQFPFLAKCISQRSISPLKVGEQVKVEKMAPQDDCMREMFVIVRWSDRTFGVPLEQLEGVKVDHDTQQAIKDWHYWKGRGYEF